jgi:hypothetical protein
VAYRDSLQQLPGRAGRLIRADKAGGNQSAELGIGYSRTLQERGNICQFVGAGTPMRAIVVPPGGALITIELPFRPRGHLVFRIEVVTG